jgi:hypothetical protein
LTSIGQCRLSVCHVNNGLILVPVQSSTPFGGTLQKRCYEGRYRMAQYIHTAQYSLLPTNGGTSGSQTTLSNAFFSNNSASHDRPATLAHQPCWVHYHTTVLLPLSLSLALSRYMVHNPPAEMTRSALRLWHMQCTCTYITTNRPRHYSGEDSSSGRSPRPCSSQLTAGYWLSTTPDVAPREGSQC